MSIHAIDANDRLLPDVQIRLQAKRRKSQVLEDVVSVGNQAGFSSHEQEEPEDRGERQAYHNYTAAADEDGNDPATGLIVNITG